MPAPLPRVQNTRQPVHTRLNPTGFEVGGNSLLAESLEVQPRLFVSHGVDKGKPERFPGGAELPVELPPPVVEPPARRARNRRAR